MVVVVRKELLGQTGSSLNPKSVVCWPYKLGQLPNLLFNFTFVKMGVRITVNCAGHAEYQCFT